MDPPQINGFPAVTHTVQTFRLPELYSAHPCKSCIAVSRILDRCLTQVYLSCKVSGELSLLMQNAYPYSII